MLFPAEGGLSRPKVPSLLAEAFYSVLIRERQSELGKADQGKMEVWQESGVSRTAGVQSVVGGDRKGIPWPRGRQFLELTRKDQVGSLFAFLSQVNMRNISL